MASGFTLFWQKKHWQGSRAMSEVARIGPADDGVERFYRLYARRSSDFAVIESDFCCRALGGAVAENKVKQLAERLMRSKPRYDQVRISLHIVHPIMERGFDDE
jgi:hypothetical protein